MLNLKSQEKGRENSLTSTSKIFRAAETGFNAIYLVRSVERINITSKRACKSHVSSYDSSLAVIIQKLYAAEVSYFRTMYQ
jgi:hypothetical protein